MISVCMFSFFCSLVRWELVGCDEHEEWKRVGNGVYKLFMNQGLYNKWLAFYLSDCISIVSCWIKCKLRICCYNNGSS